MSKEKIYSNLESKLSDFYINKELEKSQENIDKYFTPFANLRYFVDKNTGEFLYSFDDKGNLKGLNYEAIISQTHELVKKDNNGNIDQEATKKYIDEVFNKTNESFKKLKLIKDLGNYFVAPAKFQSDKIIYELPKISMDLYGLRNVNNIIEVVGVKYFENALNLLGNPKLAPQATKAIMEKIKKKDNTWLNNFLSEAEIYSKPLKSSYKFNDYLNEKIINLVSSFNDIDKEDCKKPLMSNRATEHFVGYLVSIIKEDKVFDEHASDEMKNCLKRITKKSKKQEE